MNGAHAALAALAGLLTDEPLPPDGLQMLRRELATQLRHEGRLSLDRALQLPSGTQFRRAQRDHYIVELLRLVDAPSDRARALELRRLLFGVASNGAWRRWRKVGGVPETATPLQSLVFEVLSRGKDPAVPTVPAGRALQKLVALTR